MVSVYLWADICALSVPGVKPHLALFVFSPGFEEALHFLHSKQIPDAWKMDMSEILESSSSDEGEGKESEEEEKEPEPEEVSNFSSCIIKADCRILYLGVCYV